MQLEPDSIYNVCRLGNDENVRARQRPAYVSVCVYRGTVEDVKGSCGCRLLNKRISAACVGLGALAVALTASTVVRLSC